MNNHPPDLNDVLVFVRVAQAGGFSAAARQLGMPVSTLSVRVARLEERLGVTLLQRTTRRLRLTETGQAYLQQAARGIEDLLQAQLQIDAARETPHGRLRMTLPIDMGDGPLLDIVSDFRSDHPGVDVELVFSDERLDLVAHGLDVALRMGPLTDSSLVARPVGQARWLPFAHPDYLRQAPVLRQPRDLASHDCLSFTPLVRDGWTLAKGARREQIAVRSVFQANDMRLVRQLALRGQGVALLPDFVCRQAMAQGDLVQVLAGWYARTDPIHLVYPRQRFVSAKLRRFIDETVPAFSALFNLR
ncbi:MAG: LysR family transcriptional regulator [Burkholderiaceae bacterium]